MDSALLRNGAVAGLVAGVVFLIVEMALVPTVGGGELWGPPRMMGAIALGEDVLPPPATFDAGIVAVGMIVHFALSAVLGVIFAIAAGALKLSRAMSILAGAVFGLIVYVVNFYGFTELFPWFAMARNAITIFAHLVFGGVIGWMLGGRAAGPASA
jgi:uncharacterized membrane protein YagU involved in acid resistance